MDTLERDEEGEKNSESKIRALQGGGIHLALTQILIVHWARGGGDVVCRVATLIEEEGRLHMLI